ncbi:TetR/AcrR family transcriptional regulator [Breznakia pachnodae]|jgi:AcrR family transcriptional regulator|uniref:AcrR family transcriptional regulator n=1 Tax=Breznakia pachnodae TaxID=265178 RepID=A0ABU0E6R2_9FIRM|nr:TetR/AcrR family transcriptional regulator [Breznakia pachnodae]MDQ0362404.1 AcrR family transcriptional regulator [Breznakia pachnodae]
MEKEKIDRRVRYTKMIIKDTFFELLKEKPVTKITVTEICAAADINRGTFYKYYSDPLDLLKKIEDEIFKEVLEATHKYFQAQEQTVYEFSLHLFKYLEANVNIFKILFSENGDSNFVRKVYYVMQDKVISEWKKRGIQGDKKTLDYVFCFVANGSISVIQKWLENDVQESAAEITAFIHNIGESGFLYFMDHSNIF